MPKTSKRKRKEKAENGMRPLLINAAVALAAGTVVFLIIILILSAITVKSDAPSDKLPILAYAAVGIGALACGFTASRRQRKHGALTGLVCAIPFLTLILIITLIAASGAPETAIVYNIPIVLIASAGGGVLAVNI